LITVSIIGRPNVGKSSLFNLLTKSRNALVSDIAGLTRDRHYAKTQIANINILLIDTGGIEVSSKNDIAYKMLEQTTIAIDESDIVFFVVDARSGCHPQDEFIAKNLRKKNKEIILLINKSEGLDPDVNKSNFSRLGFFKQICISTTHNQGISLISELLETSFNQSNNNLIDDAGKVRISVLGKPNVGKSTLINTILGEDRFITFNMPGTTRDSVGTDFSYKNHNLTIIDTAGIRKKGKVFDKIEKFSIIKSIFSIENSDISILVIDAIEGLTSQDLQILSYIIEAGKPLVIVINKWDLLSSYMKDEAKLSILKKINLLSNYEILYVSALKGTGLKNILNLIMNAFESSVKNIKTPILNKFLNEIQLSHQPPIFKGIRPKLKYIHQGDTSPPTFIIHGNHLSGIKKDYIRFLESSIIRTFSFKGTPVRIVLKENENPYEANDLKPKSTGLVTRRKIINKRRNDRKLKKINQ
jgi:GTP-binding protein